MKLLVVVKLLLLLIITRAQVFTITYLKKTFSKVYNAAAAIIILYRLYTGVYLYTGIPYTNHVSRDNSFAALLHLQRQI
jgi:uncharacterized protein (UPF0333 family)